MIHQGRSNCSAVGSLWYVTKLALGQNISAGEVPKDLGIVLAARVGGLAGVPGNIRVDIGNKGWRGKRGARKKMVAEWVPKQRPISGAILAAGAAEGKGVPGKKLAAEWVPKEPLISGAILAARFAGKIGASPEGNTGCHGQILGGI